MNPDLRLKLTEHLSSFISDDRMERIQQVLANRTEFVTVVLEDLYQPHNASAVLRSCDCFGIQDIHIIENRNSFDASSGVTIGADKWLTLHRYNERGSSNTTCCINTLKEKGYKIVATTPHKNGQNIEDLSLDTKTALLFGSEADGLSDNALSLSDEYVKIPMYGFSESFNISVSAALCLYILTEKMRKNRNDWHLGKRRKSELLYYWVKQSVKAGDLLEKRFLKEMD